MIIGIVGKSGSGKSTISRLFKEIDSRFYIVDIDKIGHESHNDNAVKEKLFKYFGNEIFNEDGTVNRKALSSIVFNDKDKMQLLYDATLDYMQKRIDEILLAHTYVILDYALLTKLKYFDICDIKILVKAPFDTRMSRVTKRDNISQSKFEEINLNSLDYLDNNFDYVIQNDNNPNSLRKVIGDIYEESVVSGKF